MAKNDFINGQETVLPEGQFIYSQTDPKGIITEANTLFAKISGYPASEMIGRPHNLVRHPDMPKEAFADMWRDLKAGMPWRALVKNRRSDGGFYWVVANASPVHADGKITGYQSVRTAPSRDQINAAEAVYRRIQNGDKSIRVEHGQIVPVRSALRESVDTFEHQIVLPSLATLVSVALGFASIFFGQDYRWLHYLAGAAFTLTALQAFYMLFHYLPKLISDIHSIDAFLDEILRSGNLTRELTLGRHDTVGELGRKFLLTIAWFRTSLMCINSTIETVQEITAKVITSVHDIRSAANSQSDATNSVAAAIEEMSLSILEISERLSDTEGAVNRTGDKATEGTELSVRATGEIQNLSKAIKKVTEEVEALSASSTQVGEIAGAIRAIADQTNLLALNASIEAARAGEAGRGFSVVANEVRSLADRTMKATESIDSLIEKIKADSDRAIRGIQIGSGQVETTVSLVHEAEASLDQINKMMTEAVQMVSGIAVASTEQTAAVQDIGANIANVSTMTTSNLDVAQRTSDLIDALGPKVARAKAAVAQFGM